MKKTSPLPPAKVEKLPELTELELEEKRQLIDSILARGEMCLLHGDLSGLELFETSAKLDPNNPALFFRQGLALYELGTEEGQEKILFLANRKFKRACRLENDNFEMWHAWGNSLNYLGTLFDELSYFEQAKEKYATAISLAERCDDLDTTDLYWDYGNTLMHIGRLSKEALDLRLALNALQKSIDQESELTTDFWVDFAHTNLLLTERIGDISLTIKAINALRSALASDPTHVAGWTKLAEALQALYAHTHEEDHFNQASECFAAAHHLEPQGGELLYNWAQLLLDGGTQRRDLKRLHQAIEKCHLALVCDVDEALVMALWNRSLATIGLISERLDLISEAENKMATIVEKYCDTPELWYAHGICLDALGEYFNDEDYYYQAIEKFQEGLSLNRSLDYLWHAMGQSYAKIAFMTDDYDAFEKALRFYNKALHINTSTYALADCAKLLAIWGGSSHDQSLLEQSAALYEHALHIQKNAAYLHPEWLFHYGATLDSLGEFQDDDSLYVRAIEILSHVLMIDPDTPHIHHRLALAYTHLADFTSSCETFYRAAHHFRLAHNKNEEDDQVILDWGLALINLAEHMHDREAASGLLHDAETKLIRAAKLGNIHAYYQLACLASILRHYDAALSFLEKADYFDALPSVDEITDDEWLDNIKSLPEFHAFIAQLENRPHEVGGDS